MGWPSCGGSKCSDASSATGGRISRRSRTVRPTASFTYFLISMRITEKRAGHTDASGRRPAMRNRGHGTELGVIYRDIGLPVMEGLTAFHHGAYSGVEHPPAARVDLRNRAELAQRDIIDWTLAQAAACRTTRHRPVLGARTSGCAAGQPSKSPLLAARRSDGRVTV